MAITVKAILHGVVQSHLHFKIKLLSVDCVLSGIVKPDLQNFPFYLSAIFVRLSGIEDTHVTFCCINAQYMVGDPVIFRCDGCIAPSCQERDVGVFSPPVIKFALSVAQLVG